MNAIEEYLQHMQADRRAPYQFCVVNNDYSMVSIEDIHDFNLATLRKDIVGVAVHTLEDQWFAHFLNPYGGTVSQSSFWKKTYAVQYIREHHFDLKCRFERNQNQESYWIGVMYGARNEPVSVSPPG